MTTPDDDQDIEELLAAERAHVGADAALVARIRSGAAARIALLSIPGSNGGDGGAGSGTPTASPPPGAAPPNTPPSSGSPADPASASPIHTDPGAMLDASRLLAPSAASVWGLRIAVFVAGAASGWGAHDIAHPAPISHRPTDASSSTMTVNVPATTPELAAETPDAGPYPPSRAAMLHEPARPADRVERPAPESVETMAPEVLAPATTSANRAGVDGALAEERLLLEAAQSALARGDVASALRALAEHRQRFASGRLGEEREALTVRALARAGHLDEAAARADAFRSRWPRSLLRPVVDRAAPPASPSSNGTTE